MVAESKQDLKEYETEMKWNFLDANLCCGIFGIVNQFIIENE